MAIINTARLSYPVFFGTVLDLKVHIRGYVVRLNSRKICAGDGGTREEI
jgi:hypothetical protein